VGGLRKYLQLQAQARSGLSSGLLVWGLLAIAFGTLTAVFILLIAFIWLAERYEPLIAASVLAGFSWWSRCSRSFARCGRGAAPLNVPS
jgi:hypothetical protein